MSVTDLATATAAPIEVESGGKVWKFSPITIKGFGEFEQWARAKIVSLGREQVMNLRGDEPARLCIMKAAFDKASRICFMAASRSDGEHFAQALKIVKDALPKELDPITKQAVELLANAVSIASSTEDAMSIQSVLASVDGVIRLCQLSLRKHHGEVSEEDVEAILMDEKVDANQLAEDIMRISGQATFRNTSKTRR